MLDLVDVRCKNVGKRRFVVYIRQFCAFEWYEQVVRELQGEKLAILI
jgi:hypothetical protein